MNITSITSIDLSKKRVFLRADLNVPLKNKQITEDNRLRALLPTINYIQKQGGKVILATHLGRPEIHPQFHQVDENLSTKIIARWLEKQGYAVSYEADLLEARKKSYELPSTILLLENLRFFQGEQPNNKNIKESAYQTDPLLFAELLSSLADVYINDAFGLLHRNDTSITLLAEQFKPTHRGMGLLVEQEIKNLSQLKQNVAQPFVVVLGGNKMKDKIELLEGLLKQPEKDRVKTIIIGGALAHIFLKAQGINVGASLIDSQAIPFAKEFLQKAKIANVTVFLPEDFLARIQSSDIEPMICTDDNIPTNGSAVDIGPASIRLFSRTIAQAGTIFANGTMGMYENPEYEEGSRAVLEAIARAKGYTIVGGGDAVAAAHSFKIAHEIDFISTGGGATLAFLGAQNAEEELPGLKSLAS